jgi:hypothetical protein
VRLFACACCRRIWEHLGTQMQHAVEAAELFADGQWDLVQFRAARQDVLRATQHIDLKKHPAVAAAVATVDEGTSPPWGWMMAAADNCLDVVSDTARHVGAWATERTAQAALLHDLFDHLFRPAILIAPAWLIWHQGLVPRMARDIYHHRRFEEMPVLGDALEDAGCDNPDLLSHCRDRTEHARGCWLLDDFRPPSD